MLIYKSPNCFLRYLSCACKHCWADDEPQCVNDAVCGYYSNCTFRLSKDSIDCDSIALPTPSVWSADHLPKTAPNIGKK